MKTWTDYPHPLAAVLAILFTLTAFAGCQDAPAGSETVATEAPAPGDPAHYAPDGWPLQIGDEVTFAETQQYAREFPSLSTGIALHLIGDMVYSARWGRASGGSPTTYEGHFPLRDDPLPTSSESMEHILPPRFHGKISYIPARAPYPPHLVDEVSDIGDGRPTKDGER
ncbi:MAG: hypothetical protein OXU74_17090 [Gemmatimonadota bacterium]|nr:hypothetical protein [Gemmatimonadota bacterium]